MTRSPLFYPLNRGMDADAGGVADLQTDVMRFMAILSLCLVAIFALVQSIPLAPRSQEPAPSVDAVQPETVEAPIEHAASPEPLVTAAQEIRLTRPQPQKLPPRETPPVLQRPDAQVSTVAPKSEPVATNAEPIVARPEAPQEGFTLRFEDDVALTRLVARNQVGLYAIFPEKSYRMNINRGEMSFWPASVPNEFHEMDAATVPNPVIDSLQRSNGRRAQNLQWGVTIPSATSRQLDQYLREASGGALIIDADGDLRLER
jgi:hypothetical protein